MLRYLFAVTASLVLSACVVQPPPGYWNGAATPYPLASNPAPYSQGPYSYGWNSRPAPEMPYSPGAAVSLSSRPAYNGPQSAAFTPQPASWSPQPDAYAPRSDSDSPPAPGNPRAGFADEIGDYGVPPISTLHLHDFDAPTPLRIEGARTITTIELQTMLASNRPPALIDVLAASRPSPCHTQSGCAIVVDN